MMTTSTGTYDVAKIRIQKHHRELMKVLKADGFKVEFLDTNKHSRLLVSRNGKSVKLVTGSSPSDVNFARNALAFARKELP